MPKARQRQARDLSSPGRVPIADHHNPLVVPHPALRAPHQRDQRDEMQVEWTGSHHLFKCRKESHRTKEMMGKGEWTGLHHLFKCKEGRRTKEMRCR